jgi:hypothetical protein
MAKNADLQQRVNEAKASLEAHAKEYDVGTYAALQQKIAEMQTTVNTKAAELKITAAQDSANNALTVATTNNTNTVNAIGTDAKTIQTQKK